MVHVVYHMGHGANPRCLEHIPSLRVGNLCLTVRHSAGTQVIEQSIRVEFSPLRFVIMPGKGQKMRFRQDKVAQKVPLTDFCPERTSRQQDGKYISQVRYLIDKVTIPWD
jgi:hypothetical protein